MTPTRFRFGEREAISEAYENSFSLKKQYLSESIEDVSNKYGVKSLEVIPPNAAPRTSKDLDFETRWLYFRYFEMPDGKIVRIRSQYLGDFMSKYPDAKWYHTPEEKAKLKAIEDKKAAKRAEEQRIIDEKKKLDSDYFKALESNDLETARSIIRKAAEISGYSSNNDWRMSHSAPNSQSKDDCLADFILDGRGYIVSQTNGNLVPEDYFANFRRYFQMDGDNEAAAAVRSAICSENRMRIAHGNVSPLKHHARMVVYRGVDKTKNRYERSFRNGDWVTPNYSYAVQNAEDDSNTKPRIIKMCVPINHLWWDGNNIQELGYDDGRDYAYMDVRNNRKSMETVIRDSRGRVIPPSKRFNVHREAVEY